MRRLADALGLRHWRWIIIGGGVILLAVLAGQQTDGGFAIHLGP